MEIILKNEELEVRIDSFGAELVNLIDIKTGREYMWQKDANYWAKSSPVLFPFVGALKDKKYIYDGKEYLIPTNHGFARDYPFEVVEQTKNSVKFLFSSNDETFKIYPFYFKLYINYILEGKKLILEYKVENLEDKEMLFSLGAHPAFFTPVDEKIGYDDYYIEFEKDENGTALVLNPPLISSTKTMEVFKGKTFKLDKETFRNDAIILENPNSKRIFLKNDKNNYNLMFTYNDFKYIAFWNKPGAQFVCLEPWNGISDYDNSDGILENKKGIERLEGNSEKIFRLEIEIL